MSSIEDSLLKGAITVKKYIWRATVICILILAAILIGRPLISLIRTYAEIRELNKEKAIYEESIRRLYAFLEANLEKLDTEAILKDEYIKFCRTKEQDKK